VGGAVSITVAKSQRHAGGRPRACTPRVKEILLDTARTGAHRSTIAETAGISPRTLNRFLRSGEAALEKRESGRRLTAEEEEFCQFCLDFRKAEIAVERRLVEVVLTAARSNWRAALAFLERRYPKHWARRPVVQHVIRRAPKAAVPVRPSGVDPETRELIARELERRRQTATAP
jgi:AcrR family transcriptional regulator